jgi:hypothetical protein
MTRRFIKVAIRNLTETTDGADVERVTGAQAFRAQLVVPEQRQLYDYWVERAGKGSLPRRVDIDPIRFPRLLPGISLIDVGPSLETCRVRLAGTRLREIYDREVTGQLVSQLPCGNRLEYWMAAYRRTIEQATATQGVVRGPQINKEHVVQYWMKLPLRTTSDRVDMVLCYDHFVPASELMHEPELRESVAS